MQIKNKKDLKVISGLFYITFKDKVSYNLKGDIMKNNFSKKGSVITYCVYLGIVFISVILSLNSAANNMVREIATSEAKKTAAVAISEAIEYSMENSQYPVSSATVVKYSDSGEITSIGENTYILNDIQSEISRNLNENLGKNLENAKIKIPIGNFSGLIFLSGKGKEVDFDLKYSGNAMADVKSDFISAGINQTLHEIKITINAEVTVLLPFESVKVDVSETYIMYDTMIIGEVPEFYADIY